VQHDIEYERWQYRLLARWYELRKQGKLYPLIQPGVVLHTFDPAFGVAAGTREVTWEQLEADVELAELEKMPPQSVTITVKEKTA
jgi:hypothetical protein